MKFIYFTYIYILMFANSGCVPSFNSKISENDVSNDIINKNINTTTKTTKYDTAYIYKSKNIFVYYIIIGNREDSKLYWGAQNNTFCTPQKEENYILERCSYLKCNDKVIILRSSSGSDAPMYILLPLDSSIKYQKINFPINIYISDNIIIYSGMTENKFIIIENFITHNKFEITETKLCPGANFLNMIKTAKLHKKKIYYEWYTGEDCRSNLMKKSVDLPPFIFE